MRYSKQVNTASCNLQAKTALILAGGGSRGSYELGVWQALREMEIDIHIVTGTSIGAINGAIIAQDDYDTAAALWNSIETSAVINIPINEEESLKKKIWQTYQSFVFNFIKSGGTDTNPLKKTLQAFLDEEKVRSSHIDYGLVTLEVDTNIPRELFIADIAHGKMIDYILASASIYPAFRLHKIDEVRYVDGAYHDNLPIKMAIKRGAKNIIAVDLKAFGVIKKENMALANHSIYIQSYWNLGPTLVFDRATIQRNIRLGYLDTLKAYNIYEGYAFTFIPGFCKQIAELFSDLLPLNALLQKDGGGRLDSLFLEGLEKIFNERGVPKPNNTEIALVCAELAGEIFNLDSEVIYSYETWQKCLQKCIAEAPLSDTFSPDGDAATGIRLLEALRDSSKVLISKQSRAKLAGNIIVELMNTYTYRRPVASLAVLPEVFLAGVYLAATKLV